MDRLFRSLYSRRKPIAVVLAYLAFCWLVLQLVDVFLRGDGLSRWAASAVFVVLGAGLVTISTIVFRRMAPETPAHQLAAIWFADIANYSDLMARDEARAIVLVHLFQGVARRTVRDHDGRIVKF